MTSIRRPSPSIWLVSAAILVGGAGCGSHKSATGGALSDCELGLENTAASVVLKRAHDAGRLGTSAAIAAHFKNDKPSTYLDENGKLRLLPKVTNRQTEIDYYDWIAMLEGNASSTVGDAMFAARMTARNDSPCKNKTR